VYIDLSCDLEERDAAPLASMDPVSWFSGKPVMATHRVALI
jgi:hypothetical protein